MPQALVKIEKSNTVVDIVSRSIVERFHVTIFNKDVGKTVFNKYFDDYELAVNEAIRQLRLMFNG